MCLIREIDTDQHHTLCSVVAKPAVGTFDFLSNVSGGLRNATSVFDPSRGGPSRLPRHIASDGILRVCRFFSYSVVRMLIQVGFTRFF